MKRFLALLLLAPSLALAFTTLPVSVTLSASPASIPSGGTSVLSWSSRNASACTMSSGGQSQAVATSGSLTTPPLTATTTVTLRCTRSGQSASKSVTIAVTSAPPPPPTCTAPKPADETRTEQCPSGQTGSWTQTRSYSAAAYPTCWAAGAWSPASAPAGACVGTPPPPPPPPSGGNLCLNLPAVTTTPFPQVNSARPAKGVWQTDPKTGARVMRITDAAQGAITIPAYSTVPAWNADESLIVLYVAGGSHILLNGRTYAYIRTLDINPADVEQFYWSSTDPDVLYYVDSREASGSSVRHLLRYRVSTNATEIVKDWSTEFGLSKGYNAVRSGNDPLYTSTDNTKFGQGGRLNSNGPNGASNFDGFIYNSTTGQRSPLKRLEGIVPQPTPSGRHAFVPGASAVAVLDPVTLATVRTLPVSGEEHGDLVTNAAGNDVWASIQFDGPSGSGTLITANLDTGEIKTIVGEANGFGYPPNGTHISGRAIKAPGWVAVDVIGSTNSQLLARSVFLANIDTGQKCYVAHHHSTSGDYWAEPHVVMSPSGTRLLFGSDWGGNGGQVDTYVVELPAYQR